MATLNINEIIDNNFMVEQICSYHYTLFFNINIEINIMNIHC